MDLETPIISHELPPIDVDPILPKNPFRTIFIAKQKDPKSKSIKKASYSSICRLLSYTFREHCLISLGIVLLILSQLGTVYLPYISGQIVDSILNNNDMAKMNDFCIKFLITFLISSSALFFRNICFTMIAEKVTIALKNETFARFISFDIEFFENKKTGELLSRLGSDIATIRSATSSDISVLLKSLVIALGKFYRYFFL